MANSKAILEYDENIFESIEDVGELKGHLSTVAKFLTDRSFPADEDVSDKAKEFLKDLLRQISDMNLFDQLYNEILDLALDLTVKKADCEATRTHFEVIGNFFDDVSTSGVKNKEALYKGLVKKFIHLLDNVKDERYLAVKFCYYLVNRCLCNIVGSSKDQVTLWIAMIKALLKHHTTECMDAASNAISEKEKLLKWKEFPEEVPQVFALICASDLADWQEEDVLEKGRGYRKDILINFLNMVEKTKQLPLIMDKMVAFALDCMESRDRTEYSLGVEVAEKTVFNAKKDKALMMEVMRRVKTALADENIRWDDEDDETDASVCQHRIAEILVRNALNSVSDGRVFTWEEYDELIALGEACQTDRFMHPTTGNPFTAGFDVYNNVGFKVVDWLQTMNEIERAAPLVPGCLNMLKSEEDTIKTVGADHLRMIAQTYNPLLAPYMESFITTFLEGEQHEVLEVIQLMYEHNPRPMKDHFQAVFSHLDSGNASVRGYMVVLMQKVAKLQPDLFTEENLEVVMKEAKQDYAYQAILLMTIEEIAKRRPQKVNLVLNDLMDLKKWQPVCHSIINRMLQYYALQTTSTENIQKVMDFMMKQVQTSSDQAALLMAYNAIRLIGFKHRDTIGPEHRAAIEKLRDKAVDENYRLCCVAILDMLDGKSTEKMAEELKALQADVADIDLRVTETEASVTEVKGTVARQGQELENVKNEVTEHGERLDQVEETVEETVVKVEEIDGKTLSHAPFWSRDVSKLLNPEAEHDWRLLSRRLGYSNDDIRGWAQQADPCMAMLNEWYATHKTREATHAILTALQDMSRDDAACIVENAMKNAEAVVEDEEFEYAVPPEIFISYQWGHQNEVRLLRQHLEMAGYSCWMDVGQMGGGDKLFEKIDSGIRAAKVVISCVTEKYAKSPNCNREVNLSVSLGKPIIPLLMEQTTWPPPGSMGPIFSEFLFIRFFQRPGETTTDQRYWAPAKFQELLMQLSMNGLTPDQDSVQPEYKDWWVPKIVEVVVDKDRAKKQKTSSSAPALPPSDEKAATSPDIFISYQWGRQPQILKLYQSLSGLGFRCWLDVMQMGGGDSLYDKIDRGLRGCRLVLSCVTPKYALSANCRREVSLADALKKPLVPILLEKMSWPPAGPMGPILTQLLYIDCSGLGEQWAGAPWQQLLNVINQHIDEPSNDTNSQSAKPQTDQAKENEASSKGQAKPNASPSTTNEKSNEQNGSSSVKVSAAETAAETSTKELSNTTKTVATKPLDENVSSAVSSIENNGMKKSKSCSIL